MDSILIEYNGKDYKISEPTINLWNKLNLLKDLYDSEQEYLILVISLMTGLDRENILKASWSSIQDAGEYLTDYLLKQTNDFYNEFEFQGTKYRFIDLKNITFGEFIDLDSYLQQPPSKRMSELHTLMAFLYREVGSDGKIEPYDGSKVEPRAELFKFLPVKYLNGAMRFFLTLEVLLEKNNPLIFGEGKEVDDPASPQENFSSHWGWYSALYLLSQENVLRFEEVSKNPAHSRT